MRRRPYPASSVLAAMAASVMMLRRGRSIGGRIGGRWVQGWQTAGVRAGGWRCL